MTSQTRPIVYDEAAITAGDITAEDTNLTGAHWARLLRHGVGVGSGFDLALSTTADTGTLSIGWGVWQGFELSITADEVMSLPPVSTPTTYVVGVLYNPANYSTQQGCLSPFVGVKGSITVPSGGALWTLYEVDRTQSQSLSASTVRNFKALLPQVLYAPNSLPPAGDYSLGAIAVTPTALYRRGTLSSAPAWIPDSGGTAWVNVNAAVGALPAGYGPMSTRLTDSQTTRQFRGSVKRSDGQPWAAGVTVRIGGVGTGSPPAFNRTWSVAGPSVSVLFELTTTGDINMTPSAALGSVRIDGSVPL